jgi:flagellar hook-basal body complex protein FliE
VIPAIPAIPPIPSIGSAVSAAQAAPAAASSASSAAGAAAGAGGVPGTTGSSGSFADALGGALDSLNTVQNQATNLSLQAASGNASIADVTVASTEADLQTQLVTAVRDKAVTAFQTIMNMQA